MKAYTFLIAPMVSDAMVKLGYDVKKLVEAVEADGNANLTVVDTSAKSTNRYTPERQGSRTGTAASSAATATTTVKFSGDGSAPRQFAAWHDLTVRMAKTFGELSCLPLPVTLRTWLDAKFRSGKAKVKLGPLGTASGSGKGRNVAPAATTEHAEGNGVSIEAPAIG